MASIINALTPCEQRFAHLPSFSQILRAPGLWHLLDKIGDFLLDSDLRSFALFHPKILAIFAQLKLRSTGDPEVDALFQRTIYQRLQTTPSWSLILSEGKLNADQVASICQSVSKEPLLEKLAERLWGEARGEVFVPVLKHTNLSDRLCITLLSGAKVQPHLLSWALKFSLEHRHSQDLCLKILSSSSDMNQNERGAALLKAIQLGCSDDLCLKILQTGSISSKKRGECLAVAIEHMRSEEFCEAIAQTGSLSFSGVYDCFESGLSHPGYCDQFFQRMIGDPKTGYASLVLQVLKAHRSDALCDAALNAVQTNPPTSAQSVASSIKALREAIDLAQKQGRPEELILRMKEKMAGLESVPGAH